MDTQLAKISASREAICC